jgi:D-alanine transaminase
MPHVAYVDGQYVPHRSGSGTYRGSWIQFADGVYECWQWSAGILSHLVRLARSRSELRIGPPMSDAALKIVMREVIRRNGVRNGIVYLQITRGIGPRDHAFPILVNPVLVVTSRWKNASIPGLPMTASR